MKFIYYSLEFTLIISYRHVYTDSSSRLSIMRGIYWCQKPNINYAGYRNWRGEMESIISKEHKSLYETKTVNIYKKLNIAVNNSLWPQSND